MSLDYPLPLPPYSDRDMFRYMTTDQLFVLVECLEESHKFACSFNCHAPGLSCYTEACHVPSVVLCMLIGSTVTCSEEEQNPIFLSRDQQHVDCTTAVSYVADQ